MIKDPIETFCEVMINRIGAFMFLGDVPDNTAHPRDYLWKLICYLGSTEGCFPDSADLGGYDAGGNVCCDVCGDLLNYSPSDNGPGTNYFCAEHGGRPFDADAEKLERGDFLTWLNRKHSKHSF